MPSEVGAVQGDVQVQALTTDDDYITAESDYPEEESESSHCRSNYEAESDFETKTDSSTDYYPGFTTNRTDYGTETDLPADTDTSGNYSDCADTSLELVLRPSRVSVVPVHGTEDAAVIIDTDYEGYTEAESQQR